MTTLPLKAVKLKWAGELNDLNYIFNERLQKMNKASNCWKQ